MNAMRCPISRWAISPFVSLFLLLWGSLSPAYPFQPGAEAVVVSPDGKWVYVTNSASSALEIIDATTDQLVARVPVDSGGYFLPGLAMSPDGTGLYVSAMARNQILAIDTAT